jgi:penicillin amidase
MTAGAAAPFIAVLAEQHLERAVAERASPGKGLVYNPSLPGARVDMAPAVIERLLRDRPKDWFADYDQMLLRTFAEAVDEGRRMQGRNISKWRYGDYNRLLLVHPVISRLPLVGSYFEIGPVQQSGSRTTVRQTTRRLGPSMRMAVDFADLERSLMNIATGVSGHPLSSHFRDQWEAHQAGRSFPLRFRRLEPEDTLVVVPQQPQEAR